MTETLRRLFLKPGADHNSRLIKELTKVGEQALMLERETKSSYVFRLYNMREGGKLEELNIRLGFQGWERGKSGHNLRLRARRGEGAGVLRAEA